MSIGLAAKHTLGNRWIIPYVTSGLIAMWDGEYNTGLDKPHDPSATVWKDLVGGGIVASIYTGSMSWGDDCMVSNSGVLLRCQKIGEKIATALTNRTFTLEFVGKYSGSGDWASRGYIFAKVNYFGMWKNVNIGQFDIFPTTFGSMGSCPTNAMIQRSFEMSGPKFNAYLNGLLVRSGTTTNSLTIPPTADLDLVGRGNPLYIGQVNCIRFYNRDLVTDEIAYNYSIDKERFNLT